MSVPQVALCRLNINVLPIQYGKLRQKTVKSAIALLNKQGKDAVEPVINALKTIDPENSKVLKLVLPAKEPQKITRQTTEAPVAAALAGSDTKALSGVKYLVLSDSTMVFDGTIYAPLEHANELETLAKQTVFCEAILQDFIAQADGDYTFFLLHKDWILAARDPVGVRPLYYGENSEVVALASNRRALWKLGIERAISFPPGNLAVISKEGIQFRPIKKLSYTPPQQITLENASAKLQSLLEQSVKSRLKGVSEVAVAFSGGLDSSLVAFLAKKLGVKVQLFHVSLENQPETEEAIKAAELLDLPLQVSLFKESDVEAVLPNVVELIEEADPVKASIGVPFFWTAQSAAEAGFKVMLAGQGADELFGGYQRYVTELCEYNEDKVRQTMFNDVVGIHESNLERDLKICGYHDVELRVPFGEFALARFAMSLPCELKFNAVADSERKILLRRAALDLGLPTLMVEKPKKAVQYSTGINNAVKRIAKKHGKTVSQYIEELFQK
ncbi:MAG: asparagine synthase-related protein [Candidatus Bathyarchaeota archaeon]|nr:asparagine synthase-related protein [Candidatus Bathyarchaeota archaeon]